MSELLRRNLLNKLHLTVFGRSEFRVTKELGYTR